MKKGVLMAGVAALAIVLSACGNGGTKEASSNDSGKAEVENHYFVDGKELTEEEYKAYLEEVEKQKAELTEADKGAIYTMQQIKKALVNPHSLKVYSIKYKRRDFNNEGDYIFKIEYSAENKVGGTVENTLYYDLDLNIFSDDRKKAVTAQLVGCKEVYSNDYDTGHRKDYEEFELDVDKILANIDKDIFADIKE